MVGATRRGRSDGVLEGTATWHREQGAPEAYWFRGTLTQEPAGKNLSRRP